MLEEKEALEKSDKLLKRFSKKMKIKKIIVEAEANPSSLAGFKSKHPYIKIYYGSYIRRRIRRELWEKSRFR